MIESPLKNIAEEFVKNLKNSPEAKKFLNTQEIYLDNDELQKMREKFNSLAQTFRQKQFDGTLTQEEINVIKKLQSDINRHPATLQYAQAQQELVMLLQKCNYTMSEILGFDFSATTAPAASC